jgi:hypothetical protein
LGVVDEVLLMLGGVMNREGCVAGPRACGIDAAPIDAAGDGDDKQNGRSEQSRHRLVFLVADSACTSGTFLMWTILHM